MIAFYNGFQFFNHGFVFFFCDGGQACIQTQMPGILLIAGHLFLSQLG